MKSKNNFSNILLGVGIQLADLRQKKGCSTVKEFAAKYALSEIHYWRIEHGKANVTLRSLHKILEIHKISIHEFFCLVMEQKLVA